jgi:hypothetical protein
MCGKEEIRCIALMWYLVSPFSFGMSMGRRCGLSFGGLLWLDKPKQDEDPKLSSGLWVRKVVLGGEAQWAFDNWLVVRLREFLVYWVHQYVNRDIPIININHTKTKP